MWVLLTPPALSPRVRVPHVVGQATPAGGLGQAVMVVVYGHGRCTPRRWSGYGQRKTGRRKCARSPPRLLGAREPGGPPSESLVVEVGAWKWWWC